MNTLIRSHGRGWLVTFTAAVLLTACGPKSGQGGHGGFPPAAVTLRTLAPTTVPLRFEYAGQTAGSKEAEVRARVTGILERRTYREGGWVAAGQTLFVIDSRSYATQVQQAEAALARARAQHVQAKRDLERLQPLAQSGVVSRRELDAVLSAQETAAANVLVAEAQLAEARLNLSYTTVTSPVAGFASRAQKSEGSLVAPGAESLLTTVLQIDPLHVNFSLTEGDALRINQMIARGELVMPDAATPATRTAPPTPTTAPRNKSARGFQVRLRLADGSEYALPGQMVFIDARVNPATGSFDAQAQVPNPQGLLKPGQFVRVLLDGGVRPHALTVPRRAVMEGPQGKFVYVAAKSPEGNDVALPRPVVVGDWVKVGGEDEWLIESGLQAGDAVVVEGMAKIFPMPNGAPIVVGAPSAAAAQPQQPQ